MNNQDIVDNAPEGATHIDVIGQYWMRFNGYRNKRWNKISMEWMPSPNCNLARSLADIAKIAELEKEREDWKAYKAKLLANLKYCISEDEAAIRDLRQQAKGLTDYAKEQEQGLNAVWMISAASKLIKQADELEQADEAL